MGDAVRSEHAVMTTDPQLPCRPVNLRERIAYELVKPRRWKIVEWMIWAAACVVVVWGFVVCVVIISAVLIAIIGGWGAN